MAEKKKQEALDFAAFRDQVRRLKSRWKILWVLTIIALALVVVGALFQADNFVFFVIAAFFEISVPFSFFLYFEHARIESIEEHFPDFLRDIAEFRRSGVTLSKAIQNASFNDYGQLSPEVKKIALELSWGVPFEEAMERMTNRVESKMVDRAIGIITAAQAAGGEVTTILETVSSDLRKLKELEAERKSKLSVYTMTIYTIYLLLLFIIVVLTESLVPAIPKMQAAGQFLGGTIGSITEFEFRELLFHVTMIEAFFAGLISGQMGEGKVTAGIKHSIILVLISLLAFQLVPPADPAQKFSETILDIPPSPGIASKSIEGLVSLEKDFTAAQVADGVRKIAKDRNREQYKAFEEKDVNFLAVACTPCTDGRIEVATDSVKVLKPVLLRYSVKYGGEKYVVTLSDSEETQAAAAPAQAPLKV
jgi:flagellar protein FlaJ